MLQLRSGDFKSWFVQPSLPERALLGQVVVGNVDDIRQIASAVLVYRTPVASHEMPCNLWR